MDDISKADDDLVETPNAVAFNGLEGAKAEAVTKNYNISFDSKWETRSYPSPVNNPVLSSAFIGG